MNPGLFKEETMDKKIRPLGDRVLVKRANGIYSPLECSR